RVLHSLSETPQRVAAAETSRARAAAPARRSGIHDSRTLELPPVAVSRSGRVGARSARTRRQSASISSATIIGSAVHTPWPISDLWTRIVTSPVSSRRIHAFGANGSALVAAGVAKGPF